MAKFLSKDGKFYMRDGKLLQLQPSTWLINEAPDVTPYVSSGTQPFTSSIGGVSYKFRSISIGDGVISYYDLSQGEDAIVYNESRWPNAALRKITFEEEPTGGLLTWLQANAIKVTAPIVGKTLNEYTWDEISYISSHNLTEKYGIKVGDTKSTIINGTIGNTTITNQTINAVVIGINHNAEKEGNNRIHFLIGKSGNNLCGMTDEKYNTQVSSTGWCSMNRYNNNSGGWSNSVMRQSFLGNNYPPTSQSSGSFMYALPMDLRRNMIFCTKYSNNTGGTSNLASAVTATTDYLFLLAEFEVFGARSYANTAEQNSQVQYDYFKAGNSKVAGSWGSPAIAVNWWLRSVSAGHSNAFCRVTTSGTAYASNANISYGVLPGFCI